MPIPPPHALNPPNGPLNPLHPPLPLPPNLPSPDNPNLHPPLHHHRAARPQLRNLVRLRRLHVGQSPDARPQLEQRRGRAGGRDRQVLERRQAGRCLGECGGVREDEGGEGLWGEGCGERGGWGGGGRLEEVWE